MDNASTNPSRVLQYSIDARPEPRSSPFDYGHNFRIGAAEKGMEDTIIKTRGDGIIVLPWTMPALTPQGCQVQYRYNHSNQCIRPEPRSSPFD